MATVNSNISHQPTQAAPGVMEFPIGDSSFLQKIKYDPAAFQLTVTMKNGAEYVHFQVFPATVDAMIQAPSKGKFYASEIKGKSPSANIINKNVGKQVRPLAKGPVRKETKTRGTHERK